VGRQVVFVVNIQLPGIYLPQYAAVQEIARISSLQLLTVLTAEFDQAALDGALMIIRDRELSCFCKSYSRQ